jgi:DNA-binding transcriptional LysR family regulator
MDRLKAMSVLLAVVEAGSLSAGARRLGMPLATVSRRVTDLETHLRARLFERGSRRLTLTDAGQSYVAACKRILDDVSEAERAAAGEYHAPQGELAVTAPVVFGRYHLLPVVADFIKAYPRIDVRVTLLDRLVNLAEEHVDAALRIGHLEDSSLNAQTLGVIRSVVCANPKYLAAHPVKTPRDLQNYDCITFEGFVSPKRWAFIEGKTETIVDIHSRLIVNTAEAAVDMAVTGLGVTRVFSYQIARQVASGELEIVLERYEPPPVPVSLVHGGQGQVPLKLRAFLDFAAPRLKTVLAKEQPKAP